MRTLIFIGAVLPLLVLLTPFSFPAIFASLGIVGPFAGVEIIIGAIETSTLLAILAGILGPLGAYLIAARQFSGKIETTEARELWAESRAIRDWSQRRIDALNRVVDRLEKRISELETENAELRRRLDANMGGS